MMSINNMSSNIISNTISNTSLINKEDVANLVRSYVHYDNLTSSLQKQTNNARIVRDEFENRIIKTLEEKNMKNAIIQIIGGKLQIVDEKKIASLTFNSLEESLHNYFIKNKQSDITTDLIRFIKSQRSVETVSKIKKISQLPPQP
jgi:vancomycin resistance protein YoaR